MRIISIDPGYERLGIAIIEKEKGLKETLLFSECFTTSKSLDHGSRLALIGTRVSKLIEDFIPTALAIENLFLSNNQKTVMAVSEARGVILYEAAKAHLRIVEYTPPQIKSAVCGNGRADKKAIIKMVPLLITISKSIEHDDEYDAIAIGLSFFAHEK